MHKFWSDINNFFYVKLQDLQAREDIDIHHPKDILDTQVDHRADLRIQDRYGIFFWPLNNIYLFIH